MLSFHVPAWLALAADLPVLGAGLWAGYKWGARAVLAANAVADAAKVAVKDVKKA